MAPLALLLLFAATAYMLLWRTRPPAPPPREAAPPLESLPLRSIEEALGTAQDATDDSAQMLYAVVLVDASPSLDLEAIIGTVRNKWGTSPSAAQPVPTDPALRRSVTLPCARIAFELIAPLRSHPAYVDAQGQEPSNAAEAHEAAVLVVVETQKKAVLQAVALSQFVFALLATCPQGASVLWGPSHTLWSAARAKRALAVDYEEQFPVGLWVSSRVGVQPDGRVQGYTLGLQALGSTEFEAVDAREQQHALHERLKTLAEHSLLSSRTVFNGDTTGIAGFEKIRLQRVPSQTVHAGWVFQLRYLQGSPESPGD